MTSNKLGLGISLEHQGCHDHIAKAILSGTLFQEQSAPTVYLAGPMRGYQNFNFDAFNSAAKKWFDKGYNVINPAAIDGAWKGTSTNWDYAYRDMQAIFTLRKESDDGLVMLVGWQNSIGANAEYALAKWLELKIYEV